MRKIWGIPITQLNWKYEEGHPFDPDSVYPFVEIIGNRVYCIDKDDESLVSVFHSYSPKSQPGAALNIARTIWGHPSTWERPDISARVVSCLGAPACFSCISSDQLITTGLAREWRMNRIDDTDTELRASLLINPGDPLNEHLSELHVMADIQHVNNVNNRRKELFRHAISKFGVLYDIATATADDPAITAVNIYAPDGGETAPHNAMREKNQQIDIYKNLYR